MYEYFPIEHLFWKTNAFLYYCLLFLKSSLQVSHDNILIWKRDSHLKIPPFCVLRLAERETRCKVTALNKTAAIKYQYLKLTVSQREQGCVIDWKKTNNKVMKDERCE